MIVVMIQSVRNYAHDVNRGFKKEFVDCSTVSLREAPRRGNPATELGNPPYRTGIPHDVSGWIATPYRARNDKSVWIAMSSRHWG